MNLCKFVKQNTYEVSDMMEKSTAELLNELQKAEDIFEFARENVTEFKPISLMEQLEEFKQKYQKTKIDILKSSGLDTTYGYQIMDGKKVNPSREKLIQLAFGFPLTVEEANRLLRAGGVSSLYVRSKRDAICMYCLQQKMSVDECNSLLYQVGEDTLTK